ncbi:MAG: hypothetical protein AAFV95_04395 [Bacteroidota bacterium]
MNSKTFWGDFLTSVLLLASFCVLCPSCDSGPSDPFADCRYGKPTAIFNDSLPAIQQHQFELQGKTGFERISFQNGLQLELYQSGCDNIQQEFRFSLPGQPPQDTPEFWFKQAVSLLNYLGGLSKKQQALLMWSNMIRQKSTPAKLGQAVELEPGAFAKIDHIKGTEQNLIIIELSSR